MARITPPILIAIVILSSWQQSLPAARAAAINSSVQETTFSPNCKQLAEQLGILSDLQTLVDAKQNQPDWRTNPTTRQIRQDLLESVLTAELEVRSAQSRLDSEIAIADDLRAKLEEGRDKAVTLTALANLITGAFNGVTGNSFDFSEKTETAGKILDVVEGGVAIGLAGLALKQQRGEKRFTSNVTGYLGRFFDSTTNADFPPSVWTYLNTVPAESKDSLTRRKSLIERWRNEGIVKMGQQRYEHKLKHITQHTVDRHRITMAVLEDREAMLHDLRAVISPMEETLLEIMNLIRSR